MYGKKVLFLFLFSVQPIHVICNFVLIERMKRVWQPRLEIRAKTVKTRVLGSSLSSSRSSAAILEWTVFERSDRPFRSFSVCWVFHRLNCVRDKHEIRTEVEAKLLRSLLWVRKWSHQCSDPVYRYFYLLYSSSSSMPNGKKQGTLRWVLTAVFW